MQPGKPSAVIKPTMDTKFHIDYAWWERENNDLRSYILTHLPQDLRDQMTDKDEFEQIDYIDPQTGETSYEPFAEGWLRADDSVWGRPVDVQVMADGSLLVSDDYADAIYRIAYTGD